VQKRIIGIDVGNKRIGLAQSDLLGMLASPIGTFTRGEIFKKLHDLTDREPIETFVIGWPLTLAGMEGDAIHMVKSFIGEVKKEFPGIEIIRYDERFTSVMAQKAILSSGASKKKRQNKGLVDAVAASLLLQDYLDAKKLNRNKS